MGEVVPGAAAEGIWWIGGGAGGLGSEGWRQGRG